MGVFKGKLKSGETITNSAYSLLSKAFTMIFFFVLDILCARILNADAYGEWTYFYAIITIVYSVVWFGINVSGKIFIAKSEPSKKMETFLAALRLRFFASVLLTLVYAAAVFVLCQLQVPAIQKYEHLTSLLMIGSGVVFLNSFSEFFKEVFVGLVDFRHLFVVSFCEYGGYLLFGFLGLLIRKDAVGVIWGFVISLLITVLIGFWIVFKAYSPELSGLRKSAVGLESRKIFQYAKYIALSGIGTILLTEVDTFMLGYFREGYDTAVYSIAKQLSSKAIHVNLALSTSMMPAFANITALNVKVKKERFYKVMLCNLIVTLGITLCFVAFGGFLIELLYGESYLYAVRVLYYLLPFYVISSFSKFLVLFLDYQNKAKIRSIVFCATILLDMILNAILIPEYGAIGACIATDVALMPYICFLFIEVGIIFKGYDGNDESNFIRKLRRK